MKDSLKTLIKIDKQKLDQQRRDLAQLEERLFQFQDKKQKLIEQKQAELKKINEINLPYDVLPSYQKRMDQEVAAVECQIQGFQSQIDRQKDILYQTFSQMKKYESSLEKVIEEEILDENKKEQAALDEVNVGVFNR